MSEAYKKAGVNIDAGYESVQRIKKHVQRTERPGVLGALGSFGGMFEIPTERFKNPVLVSGTDGVGTKLKLAFMLQRHETIGMDVVAMCVNDIVVQGAEPLYFLDYISCGKLTPEKIEAIVKGIADGCEQANCALIGGETAEMPGFYPDDEYDLAGFSVGIVEKDQIITGEAIEPGDLLIGLPSSGIHSNGYSLVRKLIEQKNWTLDTPFKEIQEQLNIQEAIRLDQGIQEENKANEAAFASQSLGEVLLTPTRIYVKPVLELLKRFEVKGMAHITGGGFYENIPRMLPSECKAEIDVGSWPVPPIFRVLEKAGDLSTNDLFNTFNMGIGLVLAIPNEQAVEALQFLDTVGEKAYMIGRVQQGDKGIVLAGTATAEQGASR